jgi:NADPH:quinone reductase-like Zn-dependent oxidoreductase
VQIAKTSGAHVTGLCSDAKAEVVRSIGADEVIDYAREDVTDGRQRWDAIVDTAGRRPVSRVRRALTPTGTLAIVGGDGGGRWTGGFGRQIVRAPLVSLLGRQSLKPVIATEGLDDLEALARLIDEGGDTPVVGSTYPLVDAAEAVREIGRGHALGKVVVVVHGSS